MSNSIVVIQVCNLMVVSNFYHYLVMVWKHFGFLPIFVFRSMLIHLPSFHCPIKDMICSSVQYCFMFRYWWRGDNPQYWDGDNITIYYRGNDNSFSALTAAAAADSTWYSVICVVGLLTSHASSTYNYDDYFVYSTGATKQVR